MPTQDVIENISNIAEETTIIEDATNLAEKVIGELNLPDALLISVVGFAIVFAVLGFLAAFVYLMGKVFDSVQKKREAAKKAEEVKTEEEPVQNSVNPSEYPLPDNQSMGDLKLINTTEEEAAVIMAITSNKSGIPLNRLKFNSIKLLEDDKK